ncbi:MAG TPA: hypothetical protein VFO65_12515 [Acidimicrobiales bacterium]|nr:hypothetical protein [Acidimicrobiales bacterium]
MLHLRNQHVGPDDVLSRFVVGGAAAVRHTHGVGSHGGARSPGPSVRPAAAGRAGGGRRPSNRSGPVTAPAGVRLDRLDTDAVLQLQRTAGNAAVTGLLQREGPEEDAGPPPESPDWEPLRDELGEHLWAFMEAGANYPSATRRRWAKAFSALWEQMAEPGDHSEAQLAHFRKAFDKLDDLFVDENTAAFDLWSVLSTEYQAELEYLTDSPLPDERAAAEVLAELFAETEKRVDVTADHLVQEDLAPLHQMLENGAHLERGRRLAAKESAAREAARAELAEEGEGEASPGALELAWDVVGWDSTEEFAADVILTVVTAGAGKVLKIVVKGRKAAKKLGRLEKLAKLRKLRKAARARKLAQGAADLVKAVKEAVAGGASDSAGWLKANWRKTARAYATDELGEWASGGDPGEAKTALERLSKDVITAYAGDVVGVSSADEKEQLGDALVAFAAGLTAIGRKDLKRYFAMNLKRRGLSNLLYYSLRVGVGETAASKDVVVDAAASTAAEMAQDLVLRLTGSGALGEAMVETARKTVQNTAGRLLKEALA